jgi:hypothetical protein
MTWAKTLPTTDGDDSGPTQQGEQKNEMTTMQALDQRE